MKKQLIAFLLIGTALAGAFVYQDKLKSALGIASIPAPQLDTTLIRQTNDAPAAQNTRHSTGSTDATTSDSNTTAANIPQRREQAASSPQVDESALRYFAAKGDKARLQAEIARLKALYPDWTPPADPLAPVEVRDLELENLWKLYSEGKYAELRGAIAQKRAQEPSWAVPQDLSEKLSLAEARQRIINSFDNKQYEMVVNLAAQSPALLTCSDVDIMWRLAEAFAKSGKPDRAKDGYLYVLNNCSDTLERKATLQKALENLPYDQAQEILAQQKNNAASDDELLSLADDIARRFVAKAAEDPNMQIDTNYITQLEKLAQDNLSATDAETLGWYFIRRNNPKAATKWFQLARERDDTTTIAQGLALVAMHDGNYAAAENAMYGWRNDTPEANELYFATTSNLLATDPPLRMPADIPQDVMTRIAKAVIEDKNADTAQQLGWYARAIGQNASAIQWFSTALSWDPNDEPSAYGLAVSFFSTDNEAGLAQIKQMWSGKSQRIADVGTPHDKYSRTILEKNSPEPKLQGDPVFAQRNPPASGTLAPQELKEPQAAVREARVTRPEPVKRTTPNTPSTAAANTRNCRSTLAGPMPTGGAAVAYGWCLMEINRPLEAVKSFESALQSANVKDRSEAAYGMSLAYLRVGLIDRAAEAATRAPLSAARQKELRINILTDRAVSAFKSGQYRQTLFILAQRDQIAPPRQDLMALQAASYMKLNRYEDARIVYEALADSGNREGIKGLAAIRNIQNPD